MQITSPAKTGPRILFALVWVWATAGCTVEFGGGTAGETCGNGVVDTDEECEGEKGKKPPCSEMWFDLLVQTHLVPNYPRLNIGYRDCSDRKSQPPLPNLT